MKSEIVFVIVMFLLFAMAVAGIVYEHKGHMDQYQPDTRLPYSMEGRND